jgi:hypothetical protein
MKILLIVIAILLSLVPIVWVGLQIKPAPFPPYAGKAGVLATRPLPADLPAPVTRFYQTIMGDKVPVFTSVVFSGRGRLRVAGITFPARYRFTHDAGKGYRHYIETTIWRQPMLKVNEWFLDNKAVLELPMGTTANEPKVDSAANLGLWGESFVIPSLFVTDERVRWEPVDETTALLYVPFGETEEDKFTVYFSAETGLVTHLETMRYKGAADETKVGWLLQVLSWQTYQGMQIPYEMSVTWADEGTPWLVFTADEVVYNSDVSVTIRQRGLE